MKNSLLFVVSMLTPIAVSAMQIPAHGHHPLSEDELYTLLMVQARSGEKLAELKSSIRAIDGVSEVTRRAWLSDALIEAVRAERYPGIKVLLEKGADPLGPQDAGITALRIARENEDKRMIRLLKKAVAKRQVPAVAEPHYSIHLGRKGRVLVKR